MSARAVVVGAGLAGLAAAAHLRGAGHEVTILERDPEPAGRARVLHRGGHTFDTGPTVLTMPSLVDDAMRAVGARLEDHLDLQRLDPAYRATFADGSVIEVRAEHDDMIEEIRRTCGDHDAQAFAELVTWLGRLYDAEMPHFIDRNLDSPLDLVTRPRAGLELLRLGAWRRLGPSMGRRFEDDRLQRLLTFQAMYAGLPPREALAIYAVITYMDTVEGVYFPAGGMGALARGLADAVTAAGVELVTDAEASAIVQGGDGSVAGVQLTSGEIVAADVVVATLDLPVLYRELLPHLSVPRSLRSPALSPSAVVWHVGTKGELPAGTAHHNIHFGRAWDDSFDALIHRHELMPDPSRLVSVPSLTDPSLAPEGSSTLYVLEPVPHNGSGIDWDAEEGPMRERLLTFLEDAGYPRDITVEHMDTPREWAARGMAGGTPFALAHTFGQTGPFRPANHEPRVPGLFFAGSSTTPGVGVPMVLVSGRLAAERVADHLAGGRRRRVRRRRRSDA